MLLRSAVGDALFDGGANRLCAHSRDADVRDSIDLRVVSRSRPAGLTLSDGGVELCQSHDGGRPGSGRGGGPFQRLDRG